MEQRHACVIRERGKYTKAFEMKFLRQTMGDTRRDRIRKTYITGEVKFEEIQNQIKRSRLRWFEHVRRMDQHRVPKRLLEMHMSGRRIDQFRDDVEWRG